MKMIVYLDIVSIVIGIFAVGYPFCAIWYFKKTTRLGRALVWMYAAEAFSMLLTVVFAVCALTGVLTYLSGWFQASFRLAIFISAIMSTYNLHRVIKSLGANRES